MNMISNPGPHREPALPVGLYSISVRGLDLPDLLDWAATLGVSFVHLRGGRRGFDLARRGPAQLAAWHRAAIRSRVPITGVTSDVDLADLYSGSAAARAQATTELRAVAGAGTELGARWVRVLATQPLSGTPTVTPLPAARPVTLEDCPLPVVAELHHPCWLAPRPAAALEGILGSGRLALLADTAQLSAALAANGSEAPQTLQRLFPHVSVAHLSDQGAGLDGIEHAVVARQVAHRLRVGSSVEVAVEWTGDTRTPAECARRYRSHTAWWRGLYREVTP